VLKDITDRAFQQEKEEKTNAGNFWAKGGGQLTLIWKHKGTKNRAKREGGCRGTRLVKNKSVIAQESRSRGAPSRWGLRVIYCKQQAHQKSGKKQQGGARLRGGLRMRDGRRQGKTRSARVGRHSKFRLIRWTYQYPQIPNDFRKRQ